MPATAPLASANRPVAIGSREWLNQLVADSLMVSLYMVVGHGHSMSSDKAKRRDSSFQCWFGSLMTGRAGRVIILRRRTPHGEMR